MSPAVGTWSLTIAVLAAAAAAATAVGAAKLNQPSLLSVSRKLVVAVFGLFTVAIWALGAAFVDSNFAVAYVSSYSERALPFGYKIAALWAGQEGSILLWAWLLALMSVIYVFQIGKQSVVRQSAAAVVLGICLAFFAALLVFAADPFQLNPVVPHDGHGLNPLLQHPSMIAHPPLLFVGYAGLTFPFAALIGVLVEGKGGDDWVFGVRRWLLVAWGFLTVGILLGAQWAYVELGWGGYWAWDPVENASLLPWLTATGLLHSIGCQRRFGMFRKFNAGMIVACFFLCILATYVTRSGVIQSVHAFGESLVGTFFLVFMLSALVLTILTIIIRRRVLASSQALPPLTSRPGMFMLANALLVLITAVVAIGTMFPLISSPFVDEPISVGAIFYNKIVIPMALVLMAMMALGPLLRVGNQAPQQLKKNAIIPVSLGIVGVVVSLILGLDNPWAIGCVWIVTTAASAILFNLYRLARQRMVIEGEGFGQALGCLIDSDHRRFGGQIVHVGMFMFVVGAAGSSLFSLDTTVQLQPGQKETVDHYVVQYHQMKQVEGGNYLAFQADVTITDLQTKQVITLAPQQRAYDKSEQMHAEVALNSNWSRDIYLTLLGWEKLGQLVAIRFMVNPLIAWLWYGGLVMTIGTLFCLFPTFARKPRPAHDTQTSGSPVVVHLATPTCSDTLVTSMETSQ